MERIYTLHTLFDEEEAPVPMVEKPIMPVVTDVADTTMELAQAYVRPQPLGKVFSPEEGLRHGTAFPNLSQPYMGRMQVTPC